MPGVSGQGYPGQPGLKVAKATAKRNGKKVPAGRQSNSFKGIKGVIRRGKGFGKKAKEAGGRQGGYGIEVIPRFVNQPKDRQIKNQEKSQARKVSKYLKANQHATTVDEVKRARIPRSNGNYSFQHNGWGMSKNQGAKGVVHKADL